MLFFPQLSTGASGQFPLVRTKGRRTVLNEMPDGTVLRYGDDFSECTWDLDLRELTVPERSAVEALFLAAGGRLRTFTFLDPADNLLRWSETLNDSSWLADPLLAVTSGVADPWGRQRASHLVNSGQTGQGIGQTLAVPGTFTYCVSAWIKGSGGVTWHAGAASKAFSAGPEWNRIVWGQALVEAGDSVTFRLALDPGAAIDVFGLQVEAQPSASGYKATLAQDGVYRRARFAADELNVAAEGADRDRIRVRIIAVAED